jgi:hypothetical protein
MLPKLKLRLMMAAHISSCCCIKDSHYNGWKLHVRINAIAGRTKGNGVDIQRSAEADSAVEQGASGSAWRDWGMLPIQT